jgi:hypothetical protein
MHAECSEALVRVGVGVVVVVVVVGGLAGARRLWRGKGERELFFWRRGGVYGKSGSRGETGMRIFLVVVGLCVCSVYIDLVVYRKSRVAEGD